MIVALQMIFKIVLSTLVVGSGWITVPCLGVRLRLRGIEDQWMQVWKVNGPSRAGSSSSTEDKYFCSVCLDEDKTASEMRTHRACGHMSACIGCIKAHPQIHACPICCAQVTVPVPAAAPTPAAAAGQQQPVPQGQQPVVPQGQQPVVPVPVQVQPAANPVRPPPQGSIHLDRYRGFIGRTSEERERLMGERRQNMQELIQHSESNVGNRPHLNRYTTLGAQPECAGVMAMHDNEYIQWGRIQGWIWRSIKQRDVGRPPYPHMEYWLERNPEVPIERAVDPRRYLANKYNGNYIHVIWPEKFIDPTGENRGNSKTHSWPGPLSSMGQEFDVKGNELYDRKVDEYINFLFSKRPDLRLTPTGMEITRIRVNIRIAERMQGTPNRDRLATLMVVWNNEILKGDGGHQGPAAGPLAGPAAGPQVGPGAGPAAGPLASPAAGPGAEGATQSSKKREREPEENNDQDQDNRAEMEFWREVTARPAVRRRLSISEIQSILLGHSGEQGSSSAVQGQGQGAQRYATQLEQLEGMGFTDRDHCISVLDQVGGDLNLALDYLFGM